MGCVNENIDSLKAFTNDFPLTQLSNHALRPGSLTAFLSVSSHLQRPVYKCFQPPLVFLPMTETAIPFSSSAWSYSSSRLSG